MCNKLKARSQIEDWQGEKCDVSLLERINAEIIVNMLDAACEWVRQADLSEANTEAICQRLMLRKVRCRAAALQVIWWLMRSAEFD